MPGSLYMIVGRINIKVEVEVKIEKGMIESVGVGVIVTIMGMEMATIETMRMIG